MAQQRGTATERLADVIHLALLARRTGILSVERGSGSSYEEGTITFANGQIVQASAGYRKGVDALNWLNTWGPCHFVFIQQGTMNLPPPPPSVQTGPLRNTDPRNTHPMQKIPLTPAPVNDVPPTPPPTKLPTGNSDAYMVLRSDHPEQKVPYRMKQDSDILVLMQRARLSRLHRHVLLLIDGKRTVAELAALTGRGIDELLLMLDDLERAGLIQR